MNHTPYIKSALVHVLGCKVNQAEAAAMTRILRDKGYRVDHDVEDPDLIVVNTCCVTSRAEAKSRRAVNRLVEEHPHATVIITGCLAEINPDSLAERAHRRIVIGAREKERFAELTPAADETEPEAEAPETPCDRGLDVMGCAAPEGRRRIFLKVQDGCSQACSYCIVPRARGPSRSLPESEALAQARDAADRGFSEIVLTGVHLGMYGRDFEPPSSLEALVRRIIETLPPVRVRLSSIEPPEITPGLIDLAARSPQVCRHFHIPAQNGDDALLTRMRRPYSASLIVDLTDRMKKASADICIGMDILVGFPGEDETSFARTRALIERVQPAYLHVFPFSPRPGTPAANFRPRVAHHISRRRTEELRSRSVELRAAFYQSMLGKTFAAVIEQAPAADRQSGMVRTDNYIPVKADLSRGPDSGPITVRLDRLENGQVHGTIVSGRGGEPGFR